MILNKIVFVQYLTYIIVLANHFTQHPHNTSKRTKHIQENEVDTKDLTNDGVDILTINEYFSPEKVGLTIIFKAFLHLLQTQR